MREYGCHAQNGWHMASQIDRQSGLNVSSLCSRWHMLLFHNLSYAINVCKSQ